MRSWLGGLGLLWASVAVGQEAEPLPGVQDVIRERLDEQAPSGLPEAPVDVPPADPVPDVVVEITPALGPGGFEIPLKKRTRMPYPRNKFYDRGVARTCVLKVDVGGDGKVMGTSPEDCDPVLEAWTSKRVQRWRWNGSDVDRSTLTVSVTYNPPLDTKDVPRPDYWRRREIGMCAVRMLVLRDGTLRMKGADEGCVPRLTAVSEPPVRPVEAHAPGECPMTFQSSGGEARAIDTFRCDQRLKAHGLEVVMGQYWPAVLGKPTAYTVVLEYVGLPGGPARGRLSESAGE